MIKVIKDWNDIKSNDSWAIFKIIAEFVEGYERMAKIGPCISVFGSARTKPDNKYYQLAVDTASKLVEAGFGVITGGGPGIMEAANRGAMDVEDGRSIGLNITLPFEQYPNAYITDELNFEFNYFFIRKFWFTYLAKAIVVFPGGFGTFDEFFEILTLVQTKKTAKIMLIVLFGSDFWNDVINFDGLVRRGVISEEDLELFKFADTAEDAFKYITQELERLRKLFPLYHPH